jgi:hypothetical protein
VNVPGNRQRDKAWENTPPPVEDTASRGQSQDPRYDDMGYYDIAYNYSLPYGHHEHGVADCAEVAQEPVEAQVNLPAHVFTDPSIPYTYI